MITERNDVSGPFRNSVFNSAATFENFGSICWSMLQRLEKYLRSILVFCSLVCVQLQLSPPIVPVVPLVYQHRGNQSLLQRTNSSSTWVRVLNYDEVLVLVTGVLCDCSRSWKRPHYREGIPSLSAILLTMIWFSSLVEISPVCFSSQKASAQIGRVWSDSWTQLSISRAHHSQTANILNWLVMLRKPWLLRLSR